MPRLTVTLPAELVDEVKARVNRGKHQRLDRSGGGHRLSLERLADAIAEYEAEAGTITDEDIAAARARTAWEPHLDGNNACNLGLIIPDDR